MTTDLAAPPGTTDSAGPVPDTDDDPSTKRFVVSVVVEPGPRCLELHPDRGDLVACMHPELHDGDHLGFETRQADDTAVARQVRQWSCVTWPNADYGYRTPGGFDKGWSVVEELDNGAGQVTWTFKTWQAVDRHLTRARACQEPE